MPQRLVAVFDADTAAPPVGLHVPQDVTEEYERARRLTGDMDALEARCKSAMNACHDACNPAHRLMKMFGRGNGVVYEHTPYCNYAARDGIHVMFVGEVAQWPNVDAVAAAHDAFIRGEETMEPSDAQWLLDLYGTFQQAYMAQDEVRDAVLQCLSNISGSFGFVIFDENHQAVLAARDADGHGPWYWGVTDKGQLLFGAHCADLADCFPTATPFPAGTLFASHGFKVAVNPDAQRGWVIEAPQMPGELHSFVRDRAARWKSVQAVPRVTSKGCICGSIYKVISMASIPQHAAAAMTNDDDDMIPLSSCTDIFIRPMPGAVMRVQ